MIVGVKYCGGCNSIYDRGKMVRRLKEEFVEHTYISSTEGRECDICLVVCGCMRSCASTNEIKANKKIFILATERSFEEVWRYLKQKRAMESEKAERKSNTTFDVDAKQIKIRRIGQEAQTEKAFFRDDVEQFAALTGDYSRLHMDRDFAGRSIYKRPIVHGVLVGSLISSVMGMKLPGEGTILVDEQIRFMKPVFYGESITAKVRLISCREYKDHYLGVLSGICQNQAGEIVVRAICRQLMDKQFFQIENPEDIADEL